MKRARTWAALVAAAMGLAVVGGCGSGEVDRQDELGVAGDEKYELVIVDAGEDSSAADPGRPAAEPESADSSPAQAPAPEPLAMTAGGDDAIHYAPKGAYTVQVGLYRDAKAAGRVVRELSGAGYPAYAIAQPDKKGVRVRIGYFKSRGAAQRFGERIKKDRGLDFWVDSRANEKF